MHRHPHGSRAPDKVIVYTTQDCPHCRHAKRWLKRHHIPFLDFDVARPGKMQKRFFQLGGRSVPLIIIGGRHFNGFNPQQIKTALEREGLPVS